MRERTVIGAAVLALMLSRRRIVWGDGWYWPVPSIVAPNGTTYNPVVSSGYKTSHYGVDIVFRDPTLRGFFALPGTPITAARDGIVWSVSKTARGWGVVLDHGRPFATFYQHLESVSALAKGMPVTAGQRLGTMGIDPTDPERVRHLHFAVWFDGFGDAASIDPSAVIGGWNRPQPWEAP